MQALDGAVLRDQHDALAQRLRRAADLDRHAVAQDLAVTGPGTVEPVQELALTLALETAEAEDLAALHLERPGCVPPVQLDVAHLERDPLRLGDALARGTPR